MADRPSTTQLAAACLALSWAAVACSGGGDGTGGATDAGADAAARDASAPGARDAGRFGRGDGGAADAGANATPRICSADGFCWELPVPQGETLRAAWASAPDDVWAVGDHGVVLRYDGEAFRAEPAMTSQNLVAVHGSSDRDVWIAGERGAVLHYDGESWNIIDIASLIDASAGAMTGVLHGIFAAAPDAVWAVGHSGVGAVIVRYDGERFGNDAAGLQVAHALHGVWGASAERIWAVGDGGRIVGWDGSQWQLDSSPTGAALRAVHGSSEHDVWAVGHGGAAVHWDGTRWSTANTGLAGELHAVAVDLATEPPAQDAGTGMPDPMPDAGLDGGLPPAPEGPWRVFAFGADGRVFRYNGTVWAELPSGTEHALHGAARLERGELIAVGERGQITRFSGDARISLSAGSRRNHLALWGNGTTLWAVGDEIARREASGWHVLERPTERSLYGAWGDESGVWAVGTAGAIVRFEDGELRAIDSAAAGDTWLRGVWGAGSSVWIVGHGGRALIHAAGGFLEVDAGVRANLLDVWGDADDHFWAVGEGGTVLRWDGTAWLPVPTGAMGGVVQNLRAVWGSSADDVWVVGTESTILHWDGRRFESHAQGGSYSLNDVWGTGPADVYAVGTGGVALHYDGSDWTELDTGTRSSLQSVFGDALGRVFAAGQDGVILVREP